MSCLRTKLPCWRCARPSPTRGTTWRSWWSKKRESCIHKVGSCICGAYCVFEKTCFVCFCRRFLMDPDHLKVENVSFKRLSSDVEVSIYQQEVLFSSFKTRAWQLESGGPPDARLLQTMLGHRCPISAAEWCGHIAPSTCLGCHHEYGHCGRLLRESYLDFVCDA